MKIKSRLSKKGGRLPHKRKFTKTEIARKKATTRKKTAPTKRKRYSGVKKQFPVIDPSDSS
ncbi:MAG: hypothetical protein ACFFC7_16530 [Candidatus Hermodarchaeota archaeon]